MERPSCQYGSGCYRKNPQHFIDFFHPNETHVPEVAIAQHDVTDSDVSEELPPLLPLLRQLSVSAKNGSLGSEEKAHIKDLILSGNKALVLSAVTILDSLTQSPPASTAPAKVEEKVGVVMYLIRGISGSGKSTLSTKLTTQADGSRMGMVCSTDDFFIEAATGVYKFDSARLQEAHSMNQQRVKDALRNGVSPVVVDNTNTQCWEAKPYVLMAVKFGYEVRVEEPSTSWAKDAKELARRNQHGVPLEAIQRMLDRWETDFSVQAILASRPPTRRKPQAIDDRNLKSPNRGKGTAHERESERKVQGDGTKDPLAILQAEVIDLTAQDDQDDTWRVVPKRSHGKR